METKQETKDYRPAFIMGFMVGVITIAFRYFSSKEVAITYPGISKEDKPIVVDVNRDGLEDIILPGGKVMIRQTDGTFIPLAEIRQKKIDSTMTAINRECTLRKEEIRNPFDNLDYRLNTGKYIIGGIK